MTEITEDNCFSMDWAEKAKKWLYDGVRHEKCGFSLKMASRTSHNFLSAFLAQYRGIAAGHFQAIARKKVP